MQTEVDPGVYKPDRSRAAVRALRQARRDIVKEGINPRRYGLCWHLPDSHAADQIADWIQACLDGGWVQDWLLRWHNIEATDQQLHDYRLAWIDSMIEQLKPLPKTKKEPA